MSYSMKRRAAVSVLVAGMVLGGGEAAYATTIDTAIVEGNQMVFTITLNVAPNGWAVRYEYTTQDGTAVDGNDYKGDSGKVTFNSGVKEQKVYVDTVDDNIEEDPEIFKLYLDDQEVNGLYRDVTGWVDSTTNIRGMPSTITQTGQIMDNDASGANSAD